MLRPRKGVSKKNAFVRVGYDSLLFLNKYRRKAKLISNHQ